MNIYGKIAEELGIKESQVAATVELIDEGNTIPFISRYRKEVTGGLSDDVLRQLDERLAYLRNLEARKEEVIRLIDEQGKLTDELRLDIGKAEILQRVEDIYKPFKKKRATRASKARERGLEPLANLILEERSSGNIVAEAEGFINEELGVNSAEEALQGACDIIAEIISDDPDLNGDIRDKTMKSAVMETTAADAEAESAYEMYYGKSEAVSKLPNHRILAINRGEKEKFLNVKLLVDTDDMHRLIRHRFMHRSKSISADYLEAAIKDAYSRLIAPSIEREVRNALSERAEDEAIKIFGENTRNLLMASPVKGARIISIDPGYRTGCKVAVLDETGKLLDNTTIYPTAPRNDVIGTHRKLAEYVKKYNINTISIGNGTASRETEEVVADFIRKYKAAGGKADIRYTIVNEAGASVYSASKLAAEEYPELDVTTRGAMSLGRRIQDPLAELVKIDPKSIGVGQYQHDMNQGKLNTALGNVVEDCVNRVGVDLNTASPSLLSYISGINMGIAKNIVEYREKNGRFNDRKELLKVPKLGPKAFTQCAGFMRISDGNNALDSTSVHPESYDAAKALLEKAGLKPSDVAGGVRDIDERLGKYSLSQLSDELGVGKLTLADIISEIKKPARDPREDAPAVIFRDDVRSFDDLREGMEMSGTVRNVVDFGAFVDIGVKHDGLVHISQLSDSYVKHPMDVVSVGDTVKVRIISIDTAKQRVGLSMKGIKQ